MQIFLAVIAAVCAVDFNLIAIFVFVFESYGAGEDRTPVRNSVKYNFYKLSPFGHWGRWLQRPTTTCICDAGNVFASLFQVIRPEARRRMILPGLFLTAARAFR